MGKYFIKNKQPFAFTVTNSSNIHFILFSTIAGFILLEGYKLIITAFELLGIYASSTFLMLVYSAAVLLGLGLSRRNFRKTFDKIQSEKFIKSIFVSSMLIFITVIIDFNFIFNIPIKYYINANTFLILGRSIILILLGAVDLCCT
ncbi:hypothetical protein [Gilliamella sp. Gris1-4]|uniref:hypothetical protein n=1 Tax=Gilliamella sp. Gris1-4 TaxID=3120244 RepID=UPI00080DE735|nr:hypothetical protein [Gilliamella apicola]OCG34265.1 hypothetical protein A9G31_10525 [Gilliamella apicola]OCG67094.1 hypothetical protein A9G39_05335 [Gilliamella apicola]